jgi:predicted RNA-binding protein with PIN domain
MQIIIDGYNLIRQWPELAQLDRSDLEAGREALLAVLRDYRRVKGHRITVVFDGLERGGFSETGERAAGIAVRFSRQGETADSVIARLAAEIGQSAAIVSSDHAVQSAARRGGAAAISAPDFIGRVEAARFAVLKGGEEAADSPRKTGKGTAHRLPKTERRERQRLRDL